MGRSRSILTAIALLAFSFSTVPTLAADDSSLADQLKKVKTEFDEARQAFQKNYSAAKTDEEREKIMEKSYPQPDAYADRIMAIADKAPKSDVERDAMIWIVEKLYYAPKAGKAIERLQANHLNSPDLQPAIRTLGYSRAENVPTFLRAVIKENPDRKVQAWATYILGYVLNSRDTEKNRAEAERLFETVGADFKDVDAELVKLAESQLYEIRNLSIGQVAPDIQGSDVNGKKFALSEYRGRVVVIDFWGDW
jgi:hypothetical protein